MNGILFRLFLSIILFNCFKQFNCEDILSDQDISEDYMDNEQEHGNSDEECSLSFIDKVRELHEEKRTQNTSDGEFNFDNNTHYVLDKLFAFNKSKRLKYIELLSEINPGLSRHCSHAFSTIFQSFKRSELWALKYFDSWANFPPSGSLEGVFADFGEYDECLSVKTPINMFPVMRGQYCLAKINLPFPFKQNFVEPELERQNLSIIFKPHEGFDSRLVIVRNMIEALNIVNGTIYQLGVCLPSVCSPQEVQNAINKILYPVLRLPIELNECKIEEQPILLDEYQIIAGAIFSALIILVILGTMSDTYDKISGDKIPRKTSRKTPFFTEFIESFSLMKNTKLLFAESNAKYATLDTIRLLLILNAHIVHAYMLTYTLGVKTLKKVFTYALPRFFTYSRYILVKSPLMIDALFTLSGFLISFTLLRKLRQTQGHLNYPLFIFQNWLRFVLLVFGSILFYYLAPLVEEGPVWGSATDYMTTGCKNPWNLLKIFFFVNNFQEFQVETFNQKCNITLWFMSTLLQFLIISPIFIILYHKRPRIGLIVIFTTIFISLFITISPFLLLGIKPWHQILTHGIKILTTEFNQSVNWFHTTPNVHIISYLIGICFGFLMNKKSFQINKKLVHIFWFSSVVAIVSMYYWNDTFWKGGTSYEPQLSVLLWHTIGKVLFSASFGWIYFACCTQRGGIFNQILSARIFQPLSRLSFGIYLLHYLVVLRRIFIVKQTVYIDDAIMFENLVIDLMIDVFLALIFYLLIESPFSNIFRLIFGRNQQKNVNK